MNTQELKEFDESYKWWGDFLEARKEALHAMKRLGFSYKDMQEQLNFNWEGQAEMILSCDKMIADGHEIVYIGKDDPYGGVDMDFCIVDEYSEDTGWHAMPVKEVKKPYYRVKERY